MAEDSIDVPETPEKAAHPRRYSTGNLSLSKGVGIDVLPRYLGGAPVTSCHDLCKYGIKHEPQEKPWLRKSRRNPTEQKDLVKDVLTSIVEGKKKPVFKNESPKKVAVSSPYSSSPTAKHGSSLKPRSLERTSSVPGDSKSRKFGEVAETGKSGSLKNSSPGDLISTTKSSPGTNKLLRKANPGKASSGSVSTSKKRNTSLNGNVPEKIIYTVDTKPTDSTRNGAPQPRANKKLNGTRTSLLSALSLSPRKPRPARNEPPSSSPLANLRSRPIKKAESDRRIADDNGAGGQSPTDDCQVKNIDGLEDLGPSQPLSSSPAGSPRLQSSPETKKVRATRNGSCSSLPSSSSSLKKVLTPVRKVSSSSSSTPSLKLRVRLPISDAGSNLGPKKVDQMIYTTRPRRVKIVCLDDKVRAPKKLSTKLGKASPSSSPSHLASPSTKNVEIDPTKSENQTPDLQVEQQRSTRHRRARSAGLEDEVGSPKKLHFRRGRVIDIQPRNAIIPRILKFRQRISLGENLSGRADAWRRTMKKIADGNESKGYSSATTVKVALRHQSIEGKKEAKSLFNNVIEETATLLAQTRKSKVKALVGAFETVISLQDKKKSTAT